ncbi:hTAFII28-like protein conserved region-domain-containing protein [Aspergillus granulosus]|uniref:HTAFII28-like protein conserved region-domain-containing protein n=1 Tax=Aspergillus granulosus TaxID=176169 RepID=A0ABR4H402_9EURO
MSSPPPPSNPLKRTSISSASQPYPKRPRAHPLRQTSFPADPDLRGFSATSDAGSVTGSFTGSVGGASVDGVFKRKRGRKSKAEKERERERERERSEDVGSVRTGAGYAGAGTTGGGGGGGGGNNAEDGDEEDDFDDEGELLGREEGGTATDTEAEKKNLALLVDAFTPLQSERYDLFKRAKLRKETLRRIVNHALSQSVPASVVTTINGFTKVFAGEMIEKARTVQKEWAEAHDQAALGRLAREEAETGAKVAAGDNNNNHVVKTEPGLDANTSRSTSASTTSNSNSNPAVSRNPESVAKRTAELPPNPHRGQLLPAHLREALRRYKRDGEGGGVGFSGLSLGNLGVRGSVTWTAGGVGGRRIFR